MDQRNSIHITEEMLGIVEDMSACLMSPFEIAFSIDVDPTYFKHIIEYEPINPISKAFNKGRIKTKLELHRMVIKLAQKGSPQAEQLAEKYLKEQNIDNI